MIDSTLIIDCDPGHDDAVALFIAHANRFRFREIYITTVFGNNTLENVSRNACIVNTILNGNYPIYKGCFRPIINEALVSEKFHGKSGMDGPTHLPDIKENYESEHAVYAMQSMISKSKNSVIIAALGPLTNIAMLIRLFPEIIHKISCITMMGGGIKKGNVTKHAEFNIYVDPEAAEIVFQSSIPIIMSGLDITEQVAIFPEEFSFLRKKSLRGEFFCDLMDFYVKGSVFHHTQGCIMHDPCALVYLLQPSLFDGKRGNVHVSLFGDKRGKTNFIENTTGNVLALQKGEINQIQNYILSAIDQVC